MRFSVETNPPDEQSAPIEAPKIARMLVEHRGVSPGYILTCVYNHAETDPRGLEPDLYFDEHLEKNRFPANFEPDEVILSQDGSALSIRASAKPEIGYYERVRV